MRLSEFVLASIFALLSGCASHPKSLSGQATYYVNEARGAITEGDCAKAAVQIQIALYLQTGDIKIRELFSTSATARECYYGYLNRGLDDLSLMSGLSTTFTRLNVIKSAGIFSEQQMGDLIAKFSKKITEGNVSGSMPFDLSDNLASLPALGSPFHQQIIVDRSIKKLQSLDSYSRPLVQLLDYVQTVGVGSPLGKRVESLLSTMNIRRTELESVAKIFPKYAAARKDEITARAFLQIKNGDRLLADDFLALFRSKIPGVEWVSVPGPKIVTVVIERVRNDEKVISESSQTITYAQHEVNMVNAVLLMPRNASFIYDVVSGGAEIEFGYVVSATMDGKLVHDEVVRGKVGGGYQRCQNARIQNVFGGVSSAGFVANDDMQKRCTVPNSASLDELRALVFSRVAASVRKVPSIKNAEEMN